MRIKPNPHYYAVRLFDETPMVVLHNVVGERQRLLTLVRYNRLVDRFFGSVAYSLGSWIGRSGKSQIEIDEVYVAVDKHGRQFIVPVQAKGGKDQHGIVQTAQDIAWCQSKMPKLICRPVSVQFVSPTEIAMFAFVTSSGEIKVAEERHYELVPAKSITDEDLRNYSLGATSDGGNSL